MHDQPLPLKQMSCAVFTWGSDIYGRLGHGTEDKNLQTPTEIKALSSLAIKQVTCGSAHSCILDTNGVCYTWGKCHCGQLGHGELDEDVHIPRPVEALRGVRLMKVIGGDSHVLALTAEGKVYSWGMGYYGTLGHGDESSLALPKLIETLSNEFIVSASSGSNHNFAITREGGVFVWGRDHVGQLGLPVKKAIVMGTEKAVHLNPKTPVPKALPEGDKCIQVSARLNHTLVLLESGMLLSFGCNDNGELGRVKPANDIHDINPVIDPSHFLNKDKCPETVTFINAGWKHCAAITTSGLLYTWGRGAYGRLGLGHNRDEKTPQLVKDYSEKTDPTFKDVSCGESHTLALDNKGRVWAWGSGHYGKLGLPVDGSSYVSTPQLLTFKFPELTGVCCGTNHSIAYRLI